MQAMDRSWDDHADYDLMLIIHSDPDLAQQDELILPRASDIASHIDPDRWRSPAAGGPQEGLLRRLVLSVPMTHGGIEHLLHAGSVTRYSSYFKQRLETLVDLATAGSACNTGGTSTTSAFRYQMIELVEPDLLVAASAVVESMHLNKLPPFMLNPDLVLKMLQVADRWDIPTCVSACHKALSSLAPFFTLDDVCNLFSLPSSLFNAAGMACTASFLLCNKLLPVFGNAVEVYNSEELSELWIQLPYAAVLLLLNSNHLMTDCENSVVMLLSWWLNGEVGGSVEGAELLELRASVRYGMVSPTYLTQLLPHLPKLRISKTHTLELHDYRAWRVKSAGPIPPELLSVPPSWLKPHRPQPADPVKYVSLRLIVSETQLKRQLACAAAVRKGCSTPIPAETVSTTFRGFRVSLHLGSSPTGDMTCTVSVSAQLPARSSRMRLKYGLPCDMVFGILDATDPDGSEDDDPTSQADNPTSMYATRRAKVVLGTGTACEVSQLDPERPGSPLDLNWWEPFLQEVQTAGGQSSFFVQLFATIHITPTVTYDYSDYS